MTVSTSVNYQPTVDTIVLNAYRLAGLIDELGGPGEPDWEAKAAMGRQFLDARVKWISTVGGQPRFWRSLDITTVANQQRYAVDSGVLDIAGYATYTGVGVDIAAGAPRSVLTPASRELWATMSGLDDVAVPTMYFHDKETPAGEYTSNIALYPIPDVSAANVRFQAQRRVFDSLDGGSTIDLDGVWMLALLRGLAADIALAKGKGQTSMVLESQVKAFIDTTLENQKRANRAPEPELEYEPPSLWRT